MADISKVILPNGEQYNIKDQSVLRNLVDGEATGSVRGIGTNYEDDGYSMGQYALAEGSDTRASGDGSHAEGISTLASGTASHSAGVGTTAQRKSQTVIGEYNELDIGGSTNATRGNYAFIIGNGTGNANRSNAIAVKWDGNIEMSGTPTESNHVVTKAYVDSLVSGVLHYKGVKATVSTLPSSGNTIGDVWHITADGSEYAWDGSTWQELGTAVDLSGYVPTSRTINGKALSSDITLTASDINALPSSTSIPTKVSDLTNDSGFITSYTETDPIYIASPAAGISSTDITNWNNKADEYTAGDGIDITNNVISVDSNLTVEGETAYLQYTEPIDVTKQDILVSGENIKTINNISLLGSGNLNVGASNLVNGTAIGSIRGINSKAEDSNYSLGNNSITTGVGTIGQSRSQTVIGEYNIADSTSSPTSRGQYVFLVGNGIDDNTRSNAFSVDWQGNVGVSKGLTVGANSNVTGALQVGALENDYGLNDQALLEEETKQKWNTILGNGALINLLAGNVGGRVATSGGGSTISNMNWNLIDTVIGNSSSITIPEDVFTYNEQVEVLAQVVLTQGTTDVTICGSFLIPNNNNIWMMNGYVTSSTDWGLVDFNLSDHGRTIELNNCYYAATQHNIDATVNIYYRLEESLLTNQVIETWTEILGGDPSLNPSAGNIAATGSEWLQVQDPQNLPTNVTLGSNNLMYKTSSDRNTVILTGTLSVSLAAVSITNTTIDIPLGFNVSRVPSTAVELPLGVDGNQSQATASIKVGTTGAVSLVIQVINNNSIAAELSLGFSGSFFPLV